MTRRYLITTSRDVSPTWTRYMYLHVEHARQSSIRGLFVCLSLLVSSHSGAQSRTSSKCLKDRRNDTTVCYALEPSSQSEGNIPRGPGEDAFLETVGLIVRAAHWNIQHPIESGKELLRAAGGCRCASSTSLIGTRANPLSSHSCLSASHISHFLTLTLRPSTPHHHHLYHHSSLLSQHFSFSWSRS